MKFETDTEKDILNRLTLNPDFQHYKQKLEEDYKKSVEDLLLGPGHQEVEMRRGVARELHLLMKALNKK